MKFKFPFENVMKSKKINRDVAYRNFAEAQDEADHAKSGLAVMHEDVTNSFKFNESLSTGGVLMREQLEALKWTQEFLQGQKIRIERQKDLLIQKNEVAESKAVELSEAAKEFKVFEKLKERMHMKFKKLEKKRELKDVDELVVMRQPLRSRE